QYGLVHYRGTVHLNWDHRVVFESDSALEVMEELEQRRLAAPPREGYMVAIRGVDGVGDARVGDARVGDARVGDARNANGQPLQPRFPASSTKPSPGQAAPAQRR